MRIRLQSAALAIGGVLVAAVGAWAATPYYPLDLQDADFAGVLDQSALNRSLTAADRIGVRDGHFFKVGEDGRLGTSDDQRVRLYGVNLSYSANFPDADRARAIARRLRALGFNAVRLHHLDSKPDATDDSTQSVLTQGPFPSFNLKAIARLKNFVRVLKEEGLYVNLNLYVGYPFRPVQDQVPGLSGESAAGSGGTAATPVTAALEPGSPVQLFHPRLVALQTRYAEELIRLLGIGNDPVLAMVELRNESSLAASWQAWDTGAWTRSLQGAYGEDLARQWNDWLNRRYGSINKACERWTTCGAPGPQPLPTPTEADALRTGQRGGLLGRAVDRLGSLVGQALPWKPGADAVAEAPGPTQRLMDFAQFIVDTDRQYFDSMKRTVRAATHPLLPVTGTQMGYGGVLNTLSQQGMDYVDDHFYVDHYDFPQQPWDAYDWRIKDSSLTGGEMRTLVNLARTRDLRRPFVVSEYNQAFPNRQAAEIMPVVALFAALQDWDGLFQFDYVDGDVWSGLPSGFRLAGDWGKLAVTGQSARLFRGAQVPPLVGVSPQYLGSRATLMVGAERRRVDRGLSASEPAAWTPEAAFNQRLGMLADGAVAPPVAVSATVSATVKYSSEEGRLVLEAPEVAAFVGRAPPGQAVALGGSLSAELLDPTHGFAAVVVSALDGQPLARAQRWLVSVPGHVLGSQPGTVPARPRPLVPYAGNAGWWTLEPDAQRRGKPSGPRDAVGLLWMERVPLRLSLRAASAAPQVFPLSLAGKRLDPLPPSAVTRLPGGGYGVTLQMEPRPQSPWYEIILSPAAAPVQK